MPIVTDDRARQILRKSNFFGILIPILAILFLPGAGQASAQSPSQAVLTVLLRDSYGQPLGGVLCEVLSYDWGLQVGEPYAVFARGETDVNGKVAFDVISWPRSGYFFRFSPTPRTRPENTFFESEDRNQYRGFPLAQAGGQSETQYFYIGGDGLAYNDLSEGQGPPTRAENPVHGMEQPNLTVMPSDKYLATALANTLKAQTQGTPPPSLPPPPKAFTGVAAALTATSGPISDLTAAPGASPIPVSPAAGNSLPPEEKGSSGNLFVSTLLAITGVVCFALFWKYRRNLYPWLGIKVKPKPGGKLARKPGKLSGKVRLQKFNRSTRTKKNEEEKDV